jgi:O-antigen ligase
MPYSLRVHVQSVLKRLSTLLLILGPLTTLAISPFTSFDPINLVKMMVVTGIAFSALFFVLASWKSLFTRLPIGLWIASSFFIFWMVVVLIASKAPINQQFWGVFGRNNGLLAYFSLIVILISSSLVQNRVFYHKVVDALILTSVPVTGYALVQLAGRDPITWSSMAPFATLGNINFSSAFFGLASICATVLVFSAKQKLILRIFLTVLVITNLFIILQTGSIQGFMIYIAGIGVVGFFLVRSHSSTRILRFPYLALGGVGFGLTSLALLNIGPLAKFVFGETILFRFDYWFAGWAMTLRNPIIGVGLDSYGDWYREARGEIATLRTIPDRITNTAHNIYLDISASGGIPLILAYLVLLGYAVRAAVRVLRRDQRFNSYFVALFSTWLAYLIQAAISINQIGVGVWGWLFTGCIIGYEICTRQDVVTSNQGRGREIDKQLPASLALLGMAGFALGIFASFLPYHADSKFKSALQSGNAAMQFQQAKSLGATAQHMEYSLDSAIKSNDEALATEIVEELLLRYPRDFMAWRVKQVLSSSTPEEQEEAFLRLKAMDPYNPDIKRN